MRYNQRGERGGVLEARKESASKRGGISIPNAAGPSRMGTED